MANKRKAQNAEFRKKLSTATTRVMHDPIKRTPYVKALKEKQILYVAYKQSGGELMWNDWAPQVYTKRNKL